MKKIFLILLFSFISVGVFSQEFEVPKNFEPKLKEDYAPVESQILEAISWCLNTPLNEQEEKRKEVYTFFMKWMTGTPNVSININLDKVHVSKSNPDLLLLFIMGWAKYSLENDYSKDEIKGNEAGIIATAKFYEANKKYLKKDKEVESYSKLINKGKLEEELQKRFK